MFGQHLLDSSRPIDFRDRAEWRINYCIVSYLQALTVTSHMIILQVVVDECVVDTSDVMSSCVDRCGEPYMPGEPCYCDTHCTQYENCGCTIGSLLFLAG